jgi:hypothetical protein
MSHEVYHVMPDSPVSVLEMFGTSKEQIKSFSDKVVTEVVNGNIDPLRVKVLCKTLEQIAENIDKGTKSNQVSEAAKYGDKPFAFMGAELHHTATYTSYDFSTCGDPQWESLDAELKSLQERKKAREEFLKTVSTGLTVVDDLTGEMVTLSPPSKKQSMGVKVTIK